MANTYELISSVSLSSAAASITFTSIPQTYNDLILKLSARTVAGSDDSFYVYYNSNTSNYSGRRLYSNGTGTGSDQPTYFGTVPYNSLTANIFGNAEAYMCNYASTTIQKVANTFAVQENNGSFSVSTLVANLWNDTTAITSLLIQSFTGSNFMAYSTATLYGIKNS